MIAVIRKMKNTATNFNVACENKKIVKNKCYKKTELEEQDFSEINFAETRAYSPEMLKKIEEEVSKMIKNDTASRNGGIIQVSDRGSFRYTQNSRETLVMNFANAFYPGGAYIAGGNAQEESLCRMSTLYASLKSENAKKMYDYNNNICSRFRAAASDYMLISPNVVVFRNGRNELLERYYVTAVCTIAAYDRRKASSSEDKIAAITEKRLKRFFSLAIKEGYKNLVLGAWGCGVFNNSPAVIANHFKNILINDGYIKYFDNITFAITVRHGENNFKVFTDVFKDCISKENFEENQRILLKTK